MSIRALSICAPVVPPPSYLLNFGGSTFSGCATSAKRSRCCSAPFQNHSAQISRPTGALWSICRFRFTCFARTPVPWLHLSGPFRRGIELLPRYAICCVVRRSGIAMSMVKGNLKWEIAETRTSGGHSLAAPESRWRQCTAGLYSNEKAPGISAGGLLVVLIK